MCGRYTLTSFEHLGEWFGLSEPPPPGRPRFNIAPTQPVPIVANRAQRTLSVVRWGLVPSWAKDPSVGARMINARCESAAEKPAFRDALRRRRCLVVADGFYEWQRSSGGKRGGKQPFYVHRRAGEAFGMAGLWERWRAPDGSWLETCTILTCDANELMAPIHHRMPVIVDRVDYDRWLSPEALPPQALDDLLAPPPVGDFEAYRVSPLVNSPHNDVPACVEPAQAPRPVQRSLFDPEE
ncbi:SOS response-associated peptidase [Haliangium sp.]|uniref:SOS response-associated peptidase n=1 Tax=Haliangium sp. TaxID=2663208 RepID=UPI003D0961F2